VVNNAGVSMTGPVLALEIDETWIRDQLWGVVPHQGVLRT